MAKTGAERNAEYRARKKESTDENGQPVAQMNVYVSAANRARLTALAKRNGLTQAQMLNKIIEESSYVRELEKDKDDFLSGQFSGNDESGSDI